MMQKKTEECRRKNFMRWVSLVPKPHSLVPKPQLGNALKIKILLLLSVFAGISAQAGHDPEQTAAIEASEHWLLLADAGKYRECWESAAEYMKSSIRQKEWERSVADMRGTLGKAVSRKLKTVQSETGLPGAPCFTCFRDRRYFIISYETRFENNTYVTETLTPIADSDGKWRIFDYPIRGQR
jgi:hypothetical protein